MYSQDQFWQFYFSSSMWVEQSPVRISRWFIDDDTSKDFAELQSTQASNVLGQVATALEGGSEAMRASVVRRRV